MKHKKEISSNPVFRGRFLKMCKEVGVDPLSSNKGFWADLLGVGDFYFELAVRQHFYLIRLWQVQIISICIALRPKNGGFLEEQECLRLLKQIRPKNSKEVTIQDVRKSIESINSLGHDFRIITQGGSESKRLICSVSVELNTDHMQLLSVAEGNSGKVTFS